MTQTLGQKIVTKIKSKKCYKDPDLKWYKIIKQKTIQKIAIENWYKTVSKK